MGYKPKRNIWINNILMYWEAILIDNDQEV